MQRPDEAKRRRILEAAADLFATTPFHQVTLDHIAKKARIGKGTMYLYFESKDDLYVGMILDSLENLLVDLEAKEETHVGAWEQLERFVDAVLACGRGFPELYALLRTGVATSDPRLEAGREKLAALCTTVIRRGVRSGEISDPHPDLTAQFVLSFCRVAILYAPSVSVAKLRNHILRVLRRGIRKESAS